MPQQKKRGNFGFTVFPYTSSWLYTRELKRRTKHYEFFLLINK